MIHLDTLRSRSYRIVAACLVVVIWHATGDAQSSRTQFWTTPTASGPFITVTWDPSPDPSVAGYVVYVGTESRKYTSAYDVGNRLSFVYPYATPGGRHFFSIASYTSDFYPGVLSAEVSGFGRLVPPTGYVPDFNVPAFSGGQVPKYCAFGRVGCRETATVSTSDRRINALTASVEGRVWFVEEQQQIFTIDPDGTVNRIERQSGRNTEQISNIALDPQFAQTRHVYVQELDRLRDGGREMTIVRYREVTHLLSERAVMVSGIRLPATGDAPFTVDGEGRIFVAIPRDKGMGGSREGAVFAFQRGTYARSPSGSLLSWRGLSNPSGLVWEAAGRELWLSGADGSGTAMVLRLPLASETNDPTRMTNVVPRHLFLSGPGGRLLQVDPAAARVETVLLGGIEKVVAVAGSGREVAFAVTHSRASGSRIVAVPAVD